MLGRKQFTWVVQLLRNDGRSEERKFSAYWSPAKTEPLSVAEACAAQENAAAIRGGSKFQFRPISAQLVEDAEPEPIAA